MGVRELALTREEIAVVDGVKAIAWLFVVAGGLLTLAALIGGTVPRHEERPPFSIGFALAVGALGAFGLATGAIVLGESRRGRWLCYTTAGIYALAFPAATLWFVLHSETTPGPVILGSGFVVSVALCLVFACWLPRYHRCLEKIRSYRFVSSASDFAAVEAEPPPTFVPPSDE